jgi:DNA polymerase/3'-5' exonuclease PolX
MSLPSGMATGLLRTTSLATAKKNAGLISKILEWYKYSKANKSLQQRHEELAIPRLLGALRGLDFKISLENLDRLEGIPYVGKSYVRIIAEILQTGSFTRLKMLQSNEKSNCCLEFVKIFGIGPSLAAALYELGYRKISHLKDDVFRSKGPIASQAKGAERMYNLLKLTLPYFDDMQIDYTLEQRLDLAGKISDLSKSLGLKMEVCGGTRRRKALGHDLDLLFTRENDAARSAEHFDVVSVGENILAKMRRCFFSVDVLKNNASHFADENALPETREEKHSVHLTVVQESADSPFRRVDIVVVSMMDNHG